MFGRQLRLPPSPLLVTLVFAGLAQYTVIPALKLVTWALSVKFDHLFLSTCHSTLGIDHAPVICTISRLFLALDFGYEAGDSW